MTRKIFFLAILLSAALSSSAKGNITGHVVKKETGEPLEFATIQLVNADTGKALAIGTASDIDGAFSLVEVPDGNYLVRVTCIGNEASETPVRIAGKSVRLPAISLADDALLLKEVTVEGVRGQMRFELDKKVFNVDANIAAAGASASELLESIPSVEVDQDGEVSLRGNSSVTVWINGKESGLSADNRAQILEQIPAESIDRVEVITNPSAKYDPEGTAGIINIILKRDRRGGHFGAAEIGGNSQGGANASFNINWNSGNWETYVNLGARYRRNTQGGSRTRRNYDDGTFLNSDGKSASYGNNLFLRAGATYHFTQKTEVFLNAFGMLGHRWGRTLTDYRSDLPSHWASNLNISKNGGDMRGSHAELGLTHHWTDSHTLEAMVGFNYWGRPGWDSYLQEQTYAAPAGTSSLYQIQHQDISSNSIEAKVDYTNQLNSWLKLEAGFNGNYSREDSPVSTQEGPSAANVAEAPDLYNRFIYRNNISALYATLGGKTGRFSFSAGVRSEAWQVRTQSLAYGQTKSDVPTYRKNHFALFPSVFLSYSLPAENEVQINYTRRIRRPWGGQLNSFRNISNPTSISYGNPQLEPQYTNSFELNYIKTWDYHMLSLSAYYRSTDNDINRISFMDQNVLYTTFANVGQQENSGCEIVVKNQFFSRLDITTTANLYNNHQRAWAMLFENEGNLFPVSGEARSDFAWDVRCMISLRLPWGLSLQTSGSYNSRRLTAQGSREAGWNVDAGVRKNLGNWSISLNCRDVLDSRKMHSMTYGDGYSQETERWRGGRRVQLSIKYSFGNMKAKRDKRGRSDSSEEPSDSSGYSEEGE